MNDPQILQIFGLAYLTLGLGLSVNPKFYKGLIDNYKDNPAMTMLSGILAMVVGFIIVSNHNIWSSNLSTTIVTTLGWVSLVKGMLIIIFPESMIDMSKKVAPISENTKTWSMIIFLLGLIIAYLGFFVA